VCTSEKKARTPKISSKSKNFFQQEETYLPKSHPKIQKNMKLVTIFFPLFIAICAANDRIYHLILVYLTISLTGIFLNLQINREDISLRMVVDCLSVRLFSPIGLALQTGLVGTRCLILTEVCYFILLRKIKRPVLEIVLALLFSVFYVYSFCSFTQMLLLEICLFSFNIREVFREYEIYFILSLLSLVNCISVDEFSEYDAFSPKMVLALAAFALYSLFQMISTNEVLCHILNIQKGIIKSLTFFVILLLFIAVDIWPLYEEMLDENPLFWFVRLFTANGCFGLFLSLYWSALIAFTVWLAEWIAIQFKVSEIITRKIFHFLVVVMFIPSLVNEKAYSFLIYALAGAFGVFVLLEYCRNFLILPQHDFFGRYFDIFILDDERKGGINIITSHVSLLVAVAIPIYFSVCLKHGLSLVPYFGMVAVGVGDAFAAIMGFKFGKIKWAGTNKTLLGSFAGFSSMFVSSVLVEIIFLNQLSFQEITIVGITLLFTTFAEVFIKGNDNLFLPIYSSILYTSLKLFFCD
jgi:dolichol kinase